MRQLLTTLILAAVCSTAVHAQTYDYTRATSTAQFADGATCVITYAKSGGLCNLYLEQDKRSDLGYIYLFKNDKVNRDIAELTPRTQTFTLRLIDGHYYLYTADYGGYVSVVTRNMTTNSALLYLFAITPDARDSVYINPADGNHELRIGNKLMRHHTTTGEYRMVSSTSGSYAPVQTYVVTERQGDPILDLRSDTDLSATTFSGTVRLHRTLVRGHYNTIVLPFTIDDPWQVFGSGAEIYQPQGGTQGEVSFRKLKAGEHMTGYSPYLIGGAPEEGPYLIPHVSISYKTIGTRLKTTVGSLTLHSVYQHTQMGQTANYVLYQDKFRSCLSTEQLTIGPYKWYIMPTTGSEKSPRWAHTIHIAMPR